MMPRDGIFSNCCAPDRSPDGIFGHGQDKILFLNFRSNFGVAFGVSVTLLHYPGVNGTHETFDCVQYNYFMFA